MIGNTKYLKECNDLLVEHRHRQPSKESISLAQSYP